MTHTQTPWTAIVLTIGITAGALQTASAATIDRPSTYIVRLADEPVASYAGGVAGLKATKPASGKLLNVSAADVQAYASYLNGKQLNVAAVAGNLAIAHKYNITYNGFSAVMTPAQASKLRRVPGVESVSPDMRIKLTTSHTPVFLGLDKPGGLWPQVGGKGMAGEDIIIGVIDSGISPENPAFADHVDANGVPTFNGGRLAYGPPPARWKGTCETGPGFKASDCNNKLVGARVFRRGAEQELIGQNLVIGADLNYFSPRDADGHGTHTTSTAAGNSGIQLVTANGVNAGKLSGMAPRARVAAYKACWTFAPPGEPTASFTACSMSDTIAAIEQAVKDGVNVINFSIGGTPGGIDAVDEAFLGAVSAGVFVAAGAGNSGPSTSVFHTSPWTATVGAAAFDRQFRATLTLGNGVEFEGARSAYSEAVPGTPVVSGADVSLPRDAGDDPGLSLAGCFKLDANKIQGKLVVCESPSYGTAGTTEIITRLGAAGMIGLNPVDRKELSDNAYAGSIELSNAASAAIKAYLAQAKGSATASISVPRPTYGNVTAPVLGNFSARGPNIGDPSVLKPDFAAPGVSVYAGYVAPLTVDQHLAVAAGASNAVPAYTMASGTSIATPHVAGIAALLMQRHPTWSVSAIKSALTTTAYNTRLNPDTAAQDAQLGILVGTSPLAQGAGHVDPTRAADPGLVYDVAPQDYRRYLCTLNHFSCGGLPPLKGIDLNQPSISAEMMVGLPMTIRRSVTNVSSWSSTYQAAASAPGFDVRVNPSFLTLQPGETKSFTVTLTATAAQPLWKFGGLVWDDGTHTVRSPIVARALLKTASPPLYASGYAQAVQLMTVGTATSAPLTMLTTMLKQDFVVKSGTGISVDGLCGGKPEDYAVFHSFTVAQNNKFMALASTWPNDLPPGTAGPNIIQVVSPSNKVVLSIQASDPYYHAYVMQNPEPGLWKMCGGVASEGASAAALRVWVNPGGSWGLKAMGPARTFAGGTATVVVSWAVPPQETLYFGWVDYLVGGAKVDATSVYVSTLPGTVPIFGTDASTSITAPQPTSRQTLISRRLK